jgi:hypothetical protein
MRVKQPAYNDQIIIRYLLNELSDSDQESFEVAYLKDQDLFDQLRSHEEELIEDYVKGDLSRRERRLFKQRYLVSERRRARVEAARQLIEVCSLFASSQAAANDIIGSKWYSSGLRLWLLTKQRFAQWGGVSAAILLLLGSGLAIELLRLHRQIAALNEERNVFERQAETAHRQLAHEREQVVEERGHNIALTEELRNVNERLGRLAEGPEKSQVPKDNIVFLTLMPGIRSLGNLDSAVISARTRFVELRVNLESRETANLLSYRMVVKAADGDSEIWAQEGIRPRQYRYTQYTAVKVPANRFTSAGRSDFMLTLGALTAGGKEYEEIESCYFRVISK